MNNKNLIMIVPDEMRADCTGFMGNEEVATPTLDRLAAEGVVCSRHFSNHGKCVPARAALYTGRYPNIAGHRTLGVEIQPGESNLALQLKQNGYRSAMFMRNHTVSKACHGESFDEWINAPIDNDRNHFRRNPKITSSEEGAFYWGSIEDEEYVSSDMLNTRHFCTWLRERNGDRPFFANINYINPHPPYNAPRRLLERFPLDALTLFPGDHVSPGEPEFMRRIREEYGGLDTSLSDDLKRKILQAYYAQILDVDNCVKEIESTLKETGLWEKSIIVFIGDHGDYAGQYNLVEKWDTGFQDCLLHVPFVLTGGALPYAGRRVEAFSEHVDFYPTICDLLELEKPYGISGKSIVGLIRGDSSTIKDSVYAEGGHEEELLEIEIPPQAHNAYVPCYQGKAKVRHSYPITLRKAKMIRTDEYKYIYRIAEPEELYDLRNDPGELVNLASNPAYSEVRYAMMERLLRHKIMHENHQPFDPHPIA